MKYNKYIQKETLSKLLLKSKTDTEFFDKQSKRLYHCTHSFNHFLEDEYTVDIKAVTFSDKNNVDKTYKHFSKLLKCKSSMMCPICSQSISIAKSNQLKDLKVEVEKKEHKMAFVVITVQHSYNEDLEDVYNRLADTYRKMVMTKNFKIFKEAYFIETISRGLEITVSIKKNKDGTYSKSYHPHLNLLFTIADNEEKDLDECLNISNLIYNMFNSIYKKKYKKEIQKPYIGVNKSRKKAVIKGGIVYQEEFDVSYLSKWGIENEMTGHVFKVSEKIDMLDLNGLHPFELLDLYINKTIDNKLKVLLYLMIKEYVKFVYKKRFFSLSPKLRELYKVSSLKMTDEELIENQEKMGELFYKINYQDWGVMNLSGKEKQEILLLESRKETTEYIVNKLKERSRKIDMNEVYEYIDALETIKDMYEDEVIFDFEKEDV
jgi:hypothetical protein